MSGQAIGARGKAAQVPSPDTARAFKGDDRKAAIGKKFMMDRLIYRLRVWRFGYACRHNPERIGFEVRLMLANLPETDRWTHLRELAFSETSGRFPRALGAVAASRWKITNKAEVARVFESLTKEQQKRIYAAVDFILPRPRG